MSFLSHTQTIVPLPDPIVDAAINVILEMSDFEQALEEVPPAFGVSQEEAAKYLSHGIIDYGEVFHHLRRTGRSFVQQLAHSSRTHLVSVLLEGPIGSGKTCLAASLAMVIEPILVI